ncbi:Holliday junction branch migration protein RuvA, partial [Treponema pallidum]
MFESISGILTLHERERLCVEVHGIEWEIAVSAYSSAAFGEVGSHVKV